MHRQPLHRDNAVRYEEWNKGPILTCSSDWVGFCPKERITVPSSLQVMQPSPSLSKRENASRNSSSCSSVRSLAMGLRRYREEIAWDELGPLTTHARTKWSSALRSTNRRSLHSRTTYWRRNRQCCYVRAGRLPIQSHRQRTPASNADLYLSLPSLPSLKLSHAHLSFTRPSEWKVRPFSALKWWALGRE